MRPSRFRRQLSHMWFCTRAGSWNEYALDRMLPFTTITSLHREQLLTGTDKRGIPCDR